MNSESEPVRKEEVVKVGYELEQNTNLRTEAKEAGKQAADENQAQPTATNSEDMTVDKHDSFETQAMAASTPKLKNRRKESPFLKFTVMLLMVSALFFGSLAGTYSFYTVLENSSHRKSNETSRQVSATNAYSVYWKTQENRTNATTVDFSGLVNYVSELRSIVEKLQVKMKKCDKLDAADSPLMLNMSALQVQVAGLQTKIQREKDHLMSVLHETDKDLKIQVEELHKFKRLFGYSQCVLASSSIIINQTCYRIFETEKTFPDAKVTCENFAGTLAIVDNLEKHLRIFNSSTIFKTYQERNMALHYWIGIQDLSSYPQNVQKACINKQRLWLNGNPVHFTKWNTNEPTCTYENKKENCVVAVTAGWTDVFCHNQYQFVCQFISV